MTKPTLEERVHALEVWATSYSSHLDSVPEKPVPTPKRPPALMPGYLSPYFREAEFACNHCGKLDRNVPKDLLDALEAVRAHFGKPVTINSGYRCVVHNNNVRGAKNSQHLKARAVDITISDVLPGEVHKYFETIDWPGGLGKYPTFTHVDVRHVYGEAKARWYD